MLTAPSLPTNLDSDRGEVSRALRVASLLDGDAAGSEQEVGVLEVADQGDVREDAERSDAAAPRQEPRGGCDSTVAIAKLNSTEASRIGR